MFYFTFQNTIDVKVVEWYQNVKKSYLEQTVTYFKIQTTSSLHEKFGYESTKTYEVDRRFNDFKKLHENLSINPDYQGKALPALPQDSSYMQYFTHSKAFLDERKHKLEEFLRVITSNPSFVEDKNLVDFLFKKEDFKHNEVPYSQKFTSFLNSLPSLSQISIDKDTLSAYSQLMFSKERLNEEKHRIQLKINRQEVEDSL